MSKFLDESGLDVLWGLIKGQDDDVREEMTAHANTKAMIEVGSYVGTDTFGSAKPNSLTFGFEPKLLIIFNNNIAISGYEYSFYTNTNNIINLDAVGTTYQICGPSGENGLSKNRYAKKSTNGKIFYWYNKSSAAYQLNASGVTYRYIAIG